jgi:hypothetical protein
MIAAWDTAASLRGRPTRTDLWAIPGTPLVYLNGKENQFASELFPLRLVKYLTVAKGRAQGDQS